jgi:putative ABC transport system substrate-binding protein
MSRREFITLFGSAAAAWPIAARAQQPGKVPIIGYLGSTPEVSRRYTEAFLQRLHELGWLEGRNVAIEFLWTGGRRERTGEFAAEFVRLKVDVIHVTGNPDALTVKHATSAIPIVFAVAGDPVGTGLVASLARPGGNVTGLSNQLTDAAAKRLELLREVVPSLHRIAIMFNPASSLSTREVAEVQVAARSLGIDVISVEVRQPADITSAFEAFRGRAHALYLANDGLFAGNRLRVTTMALAARLPTVFASREWLDAGGLMSFGASFVARFRRSADLVDKILRGTKPADIPVEQPTKFDLSVNLITAKALGLAISETVLVRADEVIE